MDTDDLAYYDDKLIAFREFHRRLGRSAKWLTAQVRAGLIPAVKLGSVLMFRHSTLLEIMNRGLPDILPDRTQAPEEQVQEIARVTTQLRAARQAEAGGNEE